MKIWKRAFEDILRALQNRRQVETNKHSRIERYTYRDRAQKDALRRHRELNVEPLTGISDAIISVMGAGYAVFKAVRILLGNSLVRFYHKRVA